MSPERLRVLLGIAVVAVLLAVVTDTRADPDLFGNIRFGQDVVETRSAQVDDRYSFASERTFLNHEWLFQTVAFLAFRAGGAPGVVALKLALLAVMIAAVLTAVRSANVHGPPALLLAGIVVVASFPQTSQVRAQLCSLALFAWLLVVLESARHRAAALLWLAPIMTLWVNLHGGWIVGAGTLALWHGAALLRGTTRRRALAGLAATMAACAATLVNPFGWHLWTFLRETVGFERVEIADWQPVFRLGAGYGALWSIVAALSLAATIRAIRRRDVDLQASAVVVLFAAASFRVNRLLGFFAIASVMLLAADLAALVAFTASPKADRQPSRLAAGVAAAIGFVLILGGGAMAAGNLSCIRMEPGLFAEPQVAPLVARYGLRGRMLTWFDYGHYAIWYFSPGIKVSMDGRRETVYSSAMIQRQLRFYFRPDERNALLDDLKPDYIWLPRTAAVVDPLLADGWTPLFAGPQSLVLAKHDVVGHGPIEMTSAARCFPGP